LGTLAGSKELSTCFDKALSKEPKEAKEAKDPWGALARPEELSTCFDKALSTK